MFLVQLQGGPFHNQNVLVPSLNSHVYFFRCPCNKWYQYAITEKLANAITEEDKATKARTSRKNTGVSKKPQAVYAWYKANPTKDTQRYRDLLAEKDQHQPFYEKSSSLLRIYAAAFRRDYNTQPEHFHLQCRTHQISS